jgi:uncharacterized membrane protein YadS
MKKMMNNKYVKAFMLIAPILVIASLLNNMDFSDLSWERNWGAYIIIPWFSYSFIKTLLNKKTNEE